MVRGTFAVYLMVGRQTVLQSAAGTTKIPAINWHAMNKSNAEILAKGPVFTAEHDVHAPDSIDRSRDSHRLVSSQFLLAQSQKPAQFALVLGGLIACNVIVLHVSSNYVAKIERHSSTDYLVKRPHNIPTY